MSVADTSRGQERRLRSFETAIAVEGDGRTLDARIVPFGVPATVVDPFENPMPYSEAFVRGAFERQVSAHGREPKVWLNFEHEKGIRGILGSSMALEERSDGLYGSFRITEGVDGDKALRLVEDGVLTGVSMEYIALRSRTTLSGVVERLRAHVDKVSLCRFPAYASAQILALREQPDESDDPDEPDPPEPEPEPARSFVRAEPVPMAADLAERLSQLGYRPLGRVERSTAAWDGSPDRFSDEEYERAALFSRPGVGPAKQRCSLPIREPDGAVNVNALIAAATEIRRIRGVSAVERADAARKLVRYYNAAGIEAPRTLWRLASSA